MSAASPQRLKAPWQQEYDAWKLRRLDDLEVVDCLGRWAVREKAGLEDSKAALLVLVGALTDGRTVVLTVESGQRESKESWGVVLRDLRARGLKPWRCTVADGHLGIWAALAEQQPMAAEQRCWNLKLLNVLDAMPKTHQAEAKALLTAMPSAETQTECERLRDPCSRRDRGLAPKAVERGHADWERLVTCSRVPRAHWRHLRTTVGKRYKRIDSATALIWKVWQVAEGRHQPE
ncbi:MAG: transposase [Nitrospirae bacterium]|nr:MAG: transposase [Nitrospirota bacterium]